MAATQDRTMNPPFDMGQNQGAQAGGAAQGIQDKAAGVVDTVKDAAQNVAHTVTDFAAQARDKVQGLASGAADSVHHAQESVMQFGSTAYGRTGDAMHYAGDEFTGLIRRYPIPALLAGFGVGFLLAQMIDRD